MRVSEYFHLNRHQGELDFVDVDIRGDTRVYLDPRALRLLTTDWGQECVSLIQHFFRTVLQAIRDGDDERARRLLAGLREPNETHLGLSRGRARGSALGAGLAQDVWEALSETDSTATGLLQDLEDTTLLVQGIDRDRISDISTNIIREPLIRYTEEACAHYGISLTSGVDSGPLWNQQQATWESCHVSLPTTREGKLLLVPKAIVRKKLDYERSEYLNHYLLTTLQDVELAAGSELVQLLKNGTRRVTKKAVKAKYGTNKASIARWTREYPEALENYRADKRRHTREPLTHEDFFVEGVGEVPDLDALLHVVTAIVSGRDTADEYHRAVENLLTALFYPNLTSPQIEYPIHDGRKVIDIAYANVASRGFFGWVAKHYPSAMIFVECKNYSSDPANPELDQLSSRFSPRRGQVGLLVCRTITDKERMAARCRDTANDGRGYVVVLGDDDLYSLVTQYAATRELTLLRERFNALIN
jgi:hypothetical protein